MIQKQNQKTKLWTCNLKLVSKQNAKIKLYLTVNILYNTIVFFYWRD